MAPKKSAAGVNTGAGKKKASKMLRKRNKQKSQPAAAESLGPYATVGSDIGGLLGFAPLGERIGGAIGRLFGKGDYQVLGNSLMESYGKPAAGPPPPAVFRNGKRGVRIVEREYLGEIVSGGLSGASTVFTNTSYVINPGLAGTFPWLSTIANQFDQWEPHGIVFEYRSTSSEYNGTTQALGVVVLSTDYDAVDAPYTTKVQAENSDYAMSVKASDCAIHGIECEPSERPTQILLTRQHARPSGTDPRFYDLGNFQVCTQGMSAAGVTLGELWVSYDISFYKKQIGADSEPGGGGELLSYTTSGNASTSDYFGQADADFKAWGNWNNYSFVTGTRLYLPPAAPAGARFLVSYYLYGSGATIVTPTFTGVGCTMLSDAGICSGAAASTVNPTVLAADNCYWQAIFEVSNPGSAYVLASGGTIPAAVSFCWTRVLQIGATLPIYRTPLS